MGNGLPPGWPPKEPAEFPDIAEVWAEIVDKLCPHRLPFSRVDFAASAIELGQKYPGFFVFSIFACLGVASWLLYEGQASLDRYWHAKRGVCSFESDVYRPYNETCAACHLTVGVEIPWEWELGSYHLLVVKKWKMRLRTSYYDGYQYPEFDNFHCCPTAPAVDCCSFRVEDMSFDPDPFGRRPVRYCDDFFKLGRKECPQAPWECHLLDGHLLPSPVPPFENSGTESKGFESDPRPVVGPEKLMTGHGKSWEWQFPGALLLVLLSVDLLRCLCGAAPLSLRLFRFLRSLCKLCAQNLLICGKAIYVLIRPKERSDVQLILVKGKESKSIQEMKKMDEEEQQRRLQEMEEAAVRIQRWWRTTKENIDFKKFKAVVRKAAPLKPLQPFLEPLRTAANSRSKEMRHLRSAGRVQMQRPPPNSSSRQRSASSESKRNGASRASQLEDGSVNHVETSQHRYWRPSMEHRRRSSTRHSAVNISPMGHGDADALQHRQQTSTARPSTLIRQNHQFFTGDASEMMSESKKDGAASQATELTPEEIEHADPAQHEVNAVFKAPELSKTDRAFWCFNLDPKTMYSKKSANDPYDVATEEPEKQEKTQVDAQSRAPQRESILGKKILSYPHFKQMVQSAQPSDHKMEPDTDTGLQNVDPRSAEQAQDWGKGLGLSESEIQGLVRKAAKGTGLPKAKAQSASRNARGPVAPVATSHTLV